VSKILFVDPEKCRGCQLCEIVCSMYHEKVCNPSKARIYVMKWANDDFYVPITIKCDLCNGDPNCVKFCVPDALQFIEANDTNLMKKRRALEKYSDLISNYRKNRQIRISETT